MTDFTFQQLAADEAAQAGFRPTGASRDRIIFDGLNARDIIVTQFTEATTIRIPGNTATVTLPFGSNDPALGFIPFVFRIGGVESEQQLFLGSGVGEATGNDSFFAGVGDDALYGFNGSDTLAGGDGNDLLRGGADVDFLDGGNGNDTVEGGDATDFLVGGTGDEGIDTINGGAGDDGANGNNGDDIINGDNGNDNISGNFSVGGVLTAFSGLSGGLGNDTISGGNGNDLLNGNQGDDTLNGDADADFLFGGQGNDTINGGAANDIATGGLGLDTLNGGDGNDDLRGNEGADQINGNAGEDFLFGGADVDVIRGGDDFDRIFGEAGDDQLFGDAGADRIEAGAGADFIDGGVGNDDLFGNAGNDRIEGGGGADRLTGGATFIDLVGAPDPSNGSSAATVFTGGGSDIFILQDRTAGTGDSPIGTGFNNGTGDIITDFARLNVADVNERDFLDFQVSVSATNRYIEERTIVDGDFNDAVVLARDNFRDATVRYVAVEFLGTAASANGQGGVTIFYNTDSDTDPEFQVTLLGRTLADLEDSGAFII